MTVQELIDLLQALPDDKKALPVYADGCDCIGPAQGIDIEADYVVVSR